MRLATSSVLFAGVLWTISACGSSSHADLVLRDGRVYTMDSAMPDAQALATYTVNPAFARFEEDLKGTLSVGKLADITVLSRDILTIPDDEILGTEVVYTIIAGEVRYSGGE